MALAQATGVLTGSVSDEQGGVLPGATVVAVHRPSGTRHQTVTRDDGRYVVPRLESGPYVVTVSMSGFKPLERTDLTIGSGQELAVDLRLPLEAVAENVTVMAGMALARRIPGVSMDIDQG
jgi:hypothetical protein